MSGRLHCRPHVQGRVGRRVLSPPCDGEGHPRGECAEPAHPVRMAGRGLPALSSRMEKTGRWIVFMIIVVILFAEKHNIFAGGPFCAPAGQELFNADGNPRNAWSGTQADLAGLIEKAKAQYGNFEDSKHKGRNATMLIPATLAEMQRAIACGNHVGWQEEPLDWFHQENNVLGIPKGTVRNAVNYVFDTQKPSGADENVKFTSRDGREVVYSRMTGRVVTSELLGTKNFVPQYKLFQSDHKRLDVDPHKRDKQYKYVGILYETDPDNPGKYYIVDGQTGWRMTKRQAEDFPTTLTDMWKDMGLVCVPEDSADSDMPSASIGASESIGGDTPSNQCVGSTGGTAKRTIDIPSFSDIFGGACGPCVAGDLMGTCTTVGCPNYGRPHREYKWQ